jgi:hypothetical protein
VLALTVLVCTSACRNKKQAEAAGEKDPQPAPKATAVVQEAPALTPLPLGKRELTGYAYSLGPARAAYKRAREAEKAGDWAAAESSSRKALRLDPGHLAAHWTLAMALAGQGKHKEVAEPLSKAVAGDFMRWGERSLRAPALAEFLTTPYGAAYKTLLDQYRVEFLRIVGSRYLVIGRRGKPWIPRRTGNVYINHRTEIYAYNPATGRYVRLSRTNASLVGFIRAPDRSEIAYLSYRKVWLPSDKQRAGAAKPFIRELFLGTIDVDKATIGKEVRLHNVAELDLYYSQRGKKASRLIATARYARPARGTPAVAHYWIDTARGHAGRAKRRPSGTHEILRVRYRFAERKRPRVRGIAADWSEGAAGVVQLESTRKSVAMANDESASRDSIVWSPAGTRLALTTVPVDPCGSKPGDRTVKLYIVDAASGALEAIAEGEGDLAATWFDDTHLGYVDSSTAVPAVRVVDLSTGGESVKLSTVGGIVTGHIIERQACRPPATEESSPVDPPEDDDDGVVPGKAPVPAKGATPWCGAWQGSCARKGRHTRQDHHAGEEGEGTRLRLSR